MQDNVSGVDTAEALCLVINSEKNSLEEQRAELHGASKDIISAYNRYSRARDKVGKKRSARNLARLEKAEDELGMYIDGYSVTEAKVQDAILKVVKAHDRYVEALCTAEDASRAKRSSKALDSYLKGVERFVDKINDSVACITSHYTLHIRTSSNEPKAQNLAYDMQKNEPTASFVHTNEVEISPVSIDIGPTVERAVERAISELSDTLDKRIAQALNDVEIPTAGSEDTASLSEAAEKLISASTAITDVIAQLDKIIEEIGNMADRCQKIVEMQRSTSRELQGIEVKQRLVNQEQTELAEAQAGVIEKQKALTEKIGRQSKKNEET